jgi:steroid delta-isomerase-like uncharacterized protein
VSRYEKAERTAPRSGRDILTTHCRSLQAVRRTKITAITMTTETNKAVMGRFLQFINTASEKLAEELISPDAVFHVPGRPEPMRGPAGYLAIIGMMRGGFPDIQWTLEEVIAEGDKVAARFTMCGTHRGAFFGVPPTGKTIAVQAMNFYRLSGGQFVEERGQPDLLGLLQQIGAVPTPSGA